MRLPSTRTSKHKEPDQRNVIVEAAEQIAPRTVRGRCVGDEKFGHPVMGYPEGHRIDVCDPCCRFATLTMSTDCRRGSACRHPHPSSWRHDCRPCGQRHDAAAHRFRQLLPQCDHLPPTDTRRPDAACRPSRNRQPSTRTRNRVRRIGPAKG